MDSDYSFHPLNCSLFPSPIYMTFMSLEISYEQKVLDYVT